MFGDRKGPEGRGPMTGRGAGYCAGFNRPGYANSDFARRHARRFDDSGHGNGRGYGRGHGRGYGGGYGRGYGGGYDRELEWERRSFYDSRADKEAQVTAKDEESMLQREIESLEQALKTAKIRLDKVKS